MSARKVSNFLLLADSQPELSALTPPAAGVFRAARNSGRIQLAASQYDHRNDCTHNYWLWEGESPARTATRESAGRNFRPPAELERFSQLLNTRNAITFARNFTEAEQYADAHGIPKGRQIQMIRELVLEDLKYDQFGGLGAVSKPVRLALQLDGLVRSRARVAWLEKMERGWWAYAYRLHVDFQTLREVPHGEPALLAARVEFLRRLRGGVRYARQSGDLLGQLGHLVRHGLPLFDPPSGSDSKQVRHSEHAAALNAAALEGLTASIQHLTQACVHGRTRPAKCGTQHRARWVLDEEKISQSALALKVELDTLMAVDRFGLDAKPRSTGELLPMADCHDLLSQKIALGDPASVVLAHILGAMPISLFEKNSIFTSAIMGLAGQDVPSKELIGTLAKLQKKGPPILSWQPGIREDFDHVLTKLVAAGELELVCSVATGEVPQLECLPHFETALKRGRNLVIQRIETTPNLTRYQLMAEIRLVIAYSEFLERIGCRDGLSQTERRAAARTVGKLKVVRDKKLARQFMQTLGFTSKKAILFSRTHRLARGVTTATATVARSIGSFVGLT